MYDDRDWGVGWDGEREEWSTAWGSAVMRGHQ